MERAEETSLSYWQLLQRAEEVLDQGDFVRAEQHYFLAAARRERSPGKVFFSEKLIDGLGRLLRRDRSAESGPAPGRWQRRSEAFTTRYLVEAETVVREGLRLAELRPEDDAERNQPILSSALFLVARSRLFEEEPMSAVPLLKGLFRTAGVTGPTIRRQSGPPRSAPDRRRPPLAGPAWYRAAGGVRRLGPDRPRLAPGRGMGAGLPAASAAPLFRLDGTPGRGTLLAGGRDRRSVAGTGRRQRRSVRGLPGRESGNRDRAPTRPGSACWSCMPTPGACTSRCPAMPRLWGPCSRPDWPRAAP